VAAAQEPLVIHMEPLAAEVVAAVHGVVALAAVLAVVVVVALAELAAVTAAVVVAGVLRLAPVELDPLAFLQFVLFNLEII